MTMGLLWLLFLMVLVAVTVALVYTAHHAAWAQAGDKDPVVAGVQQGRGPHYEQNHEQEEAAPRHGHIPTGLEQPPGLV